MTSGKPTFANKKPPTLPQLNSMYCRHHANVLKHSCPVRARLYFYGEHTVLGILPSGKALVITTCVPLSLAVDRTGRSGRYGL